MGGLKNDYRRHGMICVFLFWRQIVRSKKEKTKNRINKRFSELSIVPTIGLEPTTYALRVHCSTN